MKATQDINRIQAGDIETPETLLVSYCNLSAVVISNLNVEFINTAYLQIVGRMFKSVSANTLFLTIFEKLKSFYQFNKDEQDLYIFILIFQKRKDDELFIISGLDLTSEELLLVNQIKDYFKVFGNILKTVSEMLPGRKNFILKAININLRLYSDLSQNNHSHFSKKIKHLLKLRQIVEACADESSLNQQISTHRLTELVFPINIDVLVLLDTYSQFEPTLCNELKYNSITINQNDERVRQPAMPYVRAIIRNDVGAQETQFGYQGKRIIYVGPGITPSERVFDGSNPQINYFGVGDYRIQNGNITNISENAEKTDPKETLLEKINFAQFFVACEKFANYLLILLRYKTAGDIAMILSINSRCKEANLQSSDKLSMLKELKEMIVSISKLFKNIENKTYRNEKRTAIKTALSVSLVHFDLIITYFECDKVERVDEVESNEPKVQFDLSIYALNNLFDLLYFEAFVNNCRDFESQLARWEIPSTEPIINEDAVKLLIQYLPSLESKLNKQTINQTINQMTTFLLKLVSKIESPKVIAEYNQILNDFVSNFKRESEEFNISLNNLQYFIFSCTYFLSLIRIFRMLIKSNDIILTDLVLSEYKKLEILEAWLVCFLILFGFNKCENVFYGSIFDTDIMKTSIESAFTTLTTFDTNVLKQKTIFLSTPYPIATTFYDGTDLIFKWRGKNYFIDLFNGIDMVLFVASNLALIFELQTVFTLLYSLNSDNPNDNPAFGLTVTRFENAIKAAMAG